MTTLYSFPLPYEPDSLVIMEKLVNLPWPIFLDSGHTPLTTGYPEHNIDIMAAAPDQQLISNKGSTVYFDTNATYQQLDEELFSALRARLPIITPAEHPCEQVYPAAPGWMGSLSYDLSKQLENLPSTTTDHLVIPDAAMGFYPWIITTNHHTKTTCIIYTGDVDINTINKLLSNPLANPQAKEFKLTSSFSSDQTKASYQRGFDKTKDYILAGDAYQINFSQRFCAQYSGSSWTAYKLLRENNPSPMGAFFGPAEFTLLSLSPERFIKTVGRQIITSPIKGTRPRVDDPIQDQENIQRLRASSKDQAENLMIVDLLRNDFSKVCEAGSITVPTLFQVESYPNVHHLVSTIKGKLDATNDAIEAIKQCFPGGSITGAPKVRAMEIIDELEVHNRAAYCGSMVYFNVLGASDSNINIRTFVLKNNDILCWGGGGIVADSECSGEYQETFDKVGRYLTILEKTQKPE